MMRTTRQMSLRKSLNRTKILRIAENKEENALERKRVFEVLFKKEMTKMILMLATDLQMSSMNW